MVKRSLHLAALSIAVVALMGAGDEGTRFNELGHKMMCVCGCSQILLECNHVGCQYSDRMRGELLAALDRGGGGGGGGGGGRVGGSGDSDDLILQGFVQKYGTTVIAAPTTTGFNRVAWIMPFLALVLGLATTVLIVRAWRNRPPPAAPGGVLPVSGPELEVFRKKAQEDTKI